MLGNKHPFLIVLALATVLLGGASFMILQRANPADERGTLTGTTVDAADNALLKGVTVTAVDQDGVHYTNHENMDTTGADGFFCLELPPDDYSLSFEADGYQPFQSTATYTVKNGQTLEIKEDFRLVAVSSTTPDANPGSMSTNGNTSLPAEKPAAGQALTEQAPAVPPATSHTSPEETTADTDSGRPVNTTRVDKQSTSNPSAKLSENGQSVSNSSAASTGNGDDIYAQNNAASNQSLVSSAQTPDPLDSQKASFKQTSNPSVNNQTSSGQSYGYSEKEKSAAVASSTSSGRNQSSANAAAASDRTAKSQQTSFDKASETVDTCNGNTSDNADIVGNSPYTEDNGVDDGTSETNAVDGLFSDTDNFESADSEAFATGFQNLFLQEENSAEESQEKLSTEEPQKNLSDEETSIEESDSSCQKEPESDNNKNYDYNHEPAQDGVVNNDSEQIGTMREDPNNAAAQNDIFDNTARDDDIVPDEIAQEDTPGTFAPSSPLNAPADKSTLLINGHRYAIYCDVKTWKEAMDKCTERGGYLAEIDNLDENEALFQYMVEQGFLRAFFGLSRGKDDDEWHYCDGHTPSYCDWGTCAAEAPSSEQSAEESCYAALDINMNQGYWNAVSANAQASTSGEFEEGSTFAYICEWNE